MRKIFLMVPENSIEARTNDSGRSGYRIRSHEVISVSVVSDDVCGG